MKSLVGTVEADTQTKPALSHNWGEPSLDGPAAWVPL